MWSFCFAQQYTNYTTKNGLPSNHIYTIRQDHNGFVWFLTDKGMVKYNGNNFKVFTTKQGLPNNDVWEAMISSDSKMWYFSKSSELGYIKNDSVYKFPNAIEGEIMNPIYSNQVGDSIYPTGPRESYKLKNNKWQKIKSSSIKSHGESFVIHKKVKSILTNLSANEIRIVNKKDKVIKTIQLPERYEMITRRKQINDSLFTWISSKKYNILNLNTLKFTNISFKDEIGLEEVVHARITIINHELQVSGTGVVAVLDKNFRMKNPFFFPKEIKSHFALIDKTNTIWLATFSNGIYKLPYVKRNLTYNLTNNKTGKFSLINNSLYTTVFNKGFFKYNNKTKTFDSFLNVKEYPFKAAEIKEFNTVIFPSKYKFTTLKKGKLNTQNFKNVLPGTNPYGFQFVSFENSIYSLFSFGLNKINPKNITIEKEYKQSGCNQLITFKNKLIIATNNGLKEFNKGNITPLLISNKKIKKPILTIDKISDSILLLNTDGFGSYITNLKTIKQLPYTNFLTVEDAYIENNSIWLATNEGILKYTKNENNYKFIKKLTISHGLPSNNINDIIIHNNKIFASTHNGIVVIPKNQESISQFLNIYIDKALYNNTNITSNNSTIEYENDNNVSITVSSINYDESSKDISYKYKLLPGQHKWITTTSKTLNFTDLPPNNYTLSLVSNGINKNFSFKITPLWYQTVLFKLFFTTSSILLLVYILMKIRTRELAKKTAKLNTQKQLAEFELHALRSQMNPHFVFNSLNSIQYYINKNEIELSEKYLVQFSRLIRKFFDFSRDKFITLQQEISLLENYLEIEKMRFGKDFNYQFNIDNQLKINKLKIPSMLLQPIVENAVNHGLFHNEGKGIIKINFFKTDLNDFTVQILDNGVGLKKAKEIKENSIRTHISKSTEIIKTRIALLNQSKEWLITYEIKELDNENGTLVQLTFKNNE
ncbi:Two component regulator propeller [Lutibacter oricola]|uniref:Two component regulator propeller n=2 Tax=Lutibacter oricola TaxID=762486 RepID=A0A1H2U5C3_9FLAO|nr:Two component regulator propeller [Lutibacter oricola]